MDYEEVNPDPAPSDMEAVEISKLTEQDLIELDKLLYSFVGRKWKKVAYVVGRGMTDCDEKFYKIPDVFFADRVRDMIKKGDLISQGNLRNMRYCEVRLPTPSLEKLDA